MELKKKLMAILTSLTLMTQASACISNNENYQFETDYGTKNILDYSNYLRSQGINYINCTASASGSIVTIAEKHYEKYIANPSTTFVEIIDEGYYIDQGEIERVDRIMQTTGLRDGDVIFVYRLGYHIFTLDELENNKNSNFSRGY